MFTDPEPRKPEDVVKLEKALSDRSTCRATGEKIKKGDWRVGIEAWRAGRNTITWQRVLPFLKNCHMEEAERGSGTCKLTGHRFKKGEARFVCSTGDKKIYLTIPAAAQVIQPVIDAEADSFSADQIEGLDAIPEEDRKSFEAHFSMNGKRLPERKIVPKEDPEPAKKAPGKRKAGRAAKQPATKKRKSARHAKDEDNDSNASDAEEAEAESSEEGSEAESLESDTEEGGPLKKEADDVPETPSKGMTDYEKERMAIIARNKERMKQLGLEKLAAEIMPKAQPKPRTQQKGLAARRREKQTGPRRASLRQQGIQADGKMIDQELRNGQVLLGHKSGLWEPAPPSQPQEPQPPRERHAKDALPFESDNGDETLDQKLLELLKKAVAPPNSKSKAEKGSVQLQKLQLKEHDVAKVTGNGISHIQWHPHKGELIVASADKSGNVGLWHVNHESSGSGDDGVLSFKPHYSYVSGLRWVSGGGAACKLLTASYDGSLRCLDPASGRFELVVSDEDAEFSSFDCTPDGRLAILGDNDGCLHAYDINGNSGAQRGKEVEIHNKRVNTLHFAPGSDHLFVSSSSDNSLAVWDLKSLGGKGNFKSLANAVHPKTCQSAYFAPDGTNRIVSLSRDDTVKIWQFDGKSSLDVLHTIRHNNNTGRWILPFRATWSPSGDSIVVGNMKRQVDIYSAKDGELKGGLQSDYMTAISSRAAVHPELDLLAASTASGRVHIFRK